MDYTQVQLVGFLYPLVVLLVCVAVFNAIQPRKWVPEEPTIIPSRLPYIGHLIGMYIHGGKYFRMLSKSYPDLPIFTLPAVTSRIYVVTSPAVAAEVQKRRTLLFDPLVPDLTTRVLGMDSATKKQLQCNTDRAEGNWGPVPEMHDTNIAVMSNGPPLEELTNAALEELCSRVSSFGESIPTERAVYSLLSWTKDIYTHATAQFLYGPENPIATNPSLASAFWDFDAGLGSLLLDILPQFTARRPYLGRERLVAAFKEYLQADKHETPGTSAIVQRRVATERRNELSLEAQARTELSFLFAGIVNTAISSFWMVLRVFSDPTLLADLREEITNLSTSDETTLTLNIQSLRTAPLLSSLFRESLRVTSDVSSTRLVTADTQLPARDGTSYMLRSGSVVQISGAAMHADPRLWGEDVTEFNARRFIGGANTVVTTTEAASEKTRSVHPAAFRGWGGGSTLCPGRHLASAEVLMWTAAVVMSFDVESEMGGPLHMVEKEDGVLPVHVCEPREDVKVQMRWRGKRIVLKT